MESQLAKSVRATLNEAFPNTLLKGEIYVNYQGARLFFDFYLPNPKVYFEVQGEQHTVFNKHFHNSAAAFRAQKKRDRLKKEWVALEGHTLVCVNHDEIPITVKDLISKIEEAQDG